MDSIVNLKALKLTGLKPPPQMHIDRFHEAQQHDNHPTFSIPRQVLLNHGVDAKDACLMSVSGDSMLPHIKNKAVVCVDLSVKTLGEPDVYVLARYDLGGLMQIKKLSSHDSDIVKIESYNSDKYPAQLVSQRDIEILGWVFTQLPENLAQSIQLQHRRGTYHVTTDRPIPPEAAHADTADLIIPG